MRSRVTEGIVRMSKSSTASLSTRHEGSVGRRDVGMRGMRQRAKAIVRRSARREASPAAMDRSMIDTALSVSSLSTAPENGVEEISSPKSAGYSI